MRAILGVIQVLYLNSNMRLSAEMRKETNPEEPFFFFGGGGGYEFSVA